MKKLFTRTCRPLLYALGLGALFINEVQAAPVPVAVTGYTADVVADGTGAATARTTADFDGASYALMTVGYTNPAGATSTSGLPASGLITSAATSGLTFQLAAYTANNSLRLNTTGGTGTLTVTTPRTAGDVYVLASSGSGVSTMVVTVTFTDGTTQVFPATTVADWYGGTGAAIIGLGRVSVADNTITNNTSDPRLYEFRYTLSAANLSKQVQSVGFSKTSTTGVLNVMGISVNPVCSSAPTAGTAVASATNTCASAAIVLSLTGTSTDGGLSYQWQASTNGGTTYTDITGATSATYTVSGQTTTTLYRARVTCSATSQSANSTAVTISSTAPSYATLPVVESFEGTWLDVCSTRDVPTAFWRNSPGTGNPSWRRDDDGTAAGWSLPTSYIYTPLASQGSHSARFHSGYTLSGVTGALDLYVNLSAAGAKRLSFDVNNTVGSDSLVVLLSEDGGTTFTRLGRYGVVGAGFVTQVLPISSTSATAVIRFRGRGDYASNDIGLDNVILESATGCLTPASLTATAVTTTTATLSWLTGGTGTYTVVYGPTGFNPATGGTTVSGITTGSTNLTGLTPATTYQFYVTANCGTGSNSGTAGPVTFTTLILNDNPCGATQLTINNVCTPVTSTTIGATQTPSTTYTGGTQGTGCGSVSAPRDVWFQFTTAATGPTSTQVRITVTGGAASVVRAYSGTACTGPLTYISCVGTASNTAAPVLDLTSLTPSTTYYIRVNEYSTTGTLGSFTICASPVPNCPAPTGLTAGSLTSFTAVLSWSGTLSTGGTYSVIYGPRGFIPSASGTTVSGLTANTTTINGLSPTTDYDFYVQQICGGFNGSSTLVGPSLFTTPLTVPANDEPCGAIALSSTPVSANNIGSTTTTLGSIFLPACVGGQQPKDVWFAFTASATSSTMTLTGAPAGALRVYTAASCSAGPFNSVFCQGSGANNTAFAAPVVVSPLTVGTRYYVAVSGFGSSDTPGAFTIAASNVLAARAQTNSTALSVFPNPSNTGQLTLRFSGLGASQATLLNALGQSVRTLQLPAGQAEHTLKTQGLAAGVYTLRLQAGTEVFTQKVVLE
ncbi:fibronectin type III domain-containing protein [Hymenobacter convexus]|uniref:fibronectin type III domain-containing protein n=1 Tax=Hymenobacter sp. CA1UV-4 TaxID=3063782 RepID=UPI0027139620|nr:fibronectin type III domain-containing protein [Hymenobacter sp. CA1UV-4]MDO7851693.1 fibronectin type III domain-containing protein [Hymenobacter sp. CA1UV-4]